MRKNVFYILAYAFRLAGCNDDPSFEEEGVPQIKVYQIVFNIQMEKEVIYLSRKHKYSSSKVKNESSK